jgi:hypothetical protein
MLTFACGNTKMMGIINLVDMHFINIRYNFCSLRFLYEIGLVLDLMYARVRVCVVMLGMVQGGWRFSNRKILRYMCKENKIVLLLVRLSVLLARSTPRRTRLWQIGEAYTKYPSRYSARIISYFYGKPFRDQR